MIPYNQTSLASTIKVRAVKQDGTRAGSNTLEILAGQTGTLNLNKKKDFQEIEVWVSSATNQGKITMACDTIREVLRNDKNRKVYVSDNIDSDPKLKYLVYNCGVAYGNGDHPFYRPH